MSKLHEDRASVWTLMEEKVKAGADTWSAEDTAAYEKMEDDYRSLTSKIEAEERFAQLSKPVGPVVSTTSTSDQNVSLNESDTRAYGEAFNAYLRGGDVRLTSEQRDLLTASESRTMSTGIGSEGGYLVPETMRTTIIEALKDYGGLRNLAEVITTDNGTDLLMPKNDDTANEGEIVAENTEVSDLDPDFELVTLRAYIYSSKAVRIPISLLQDSGVALEPYIGRKQGERIGRKQATGWVHGTGAGEPQGLIGGRDTTKDVDVTAAVSFDNLQDLIRKVDPAYRRLPGTGFLMNDTVAGAIRKIKTGIASDNTTLWQPSFQLGEPDRLLGFPVTIDQAMDADAATGGGSGATGKPVAFGNFREAYIVRDVRGLAVLRLDQTRARFFQVEFIGFLRSDGGVKNTAAYACIERTS